MSFQLNGLRLHGWSSFFRGIVSSTVLISAATQFIIEVGARSYFDLVFYFFVTSALLYALFVFLENRQIHLIYLWILGFGFASSVLQFAHLPGHWGIYSMAIFALVMDSFSNNFTYLALPQEPVGLYRESIQAATINYSAGCVVGSIIIAYLSYIQDTRWFFSIFWLSSLMLEVSYAAINAGRE